MSFYSMHRKENEARIYKDGELLEVKENFNILKIEATNKNGKPINVIKRVVLCDHHPCKYPECNCKRTITE